MIECNICTYGQFDFNFDRHVPPNRSLLRGQRNKPVAFCSCIPWEEHLFFRSFCFEHQSLVPNFSCKMVAVPFEYKMCHKGASHTKVLQGKSTSNGRWCTAGPDGNQRLLEAWMDNGPIGKEFFLTVAPMIAFKLQVQSVTADGLVLVRSNGAEHQVWFARPKGDRLLLSADIVAPQTDDGEVWCGIRRLSGELIWHDVQLVLLVYVFFW